MRQVAPLLLCLVSLALAWPLRVEAEGADELVVGPYLQLARPDSIWVLWETATGEDGRVEWGQTASLGQVSTGSSIVTRGAARVHEVLLEGLSPGTHYFYRVSTGSTVSGVQRFTTPHLPEAEAPTRLVVMSDMQRDGENPEVFAELVERGVSAIAQERYGPALDEGLALALLAGDLVADGREHDQWREHFFRPLATFAAAVPLLPVLGNHEHFSDLYFAYFHLPANGVAGLEEHWWRHDVANLRILGLDSNIGPLAVGQVEFLDAALDDACQARQIDFVFVQLHHPAQSELWPEGENGYSGDVVVALEAFSERCDKPSVLFFGHTHGYSRGQARDHRHLMVNVASAGGNLDYWGEYEQVDYEEFTVSQDEWGFVLVEVEAGEDPRLSLTRFSRGNELLPRSNEVRDTVTLRRFNGRPSAPAPSWPRGREINPRCTAWEAGPFADSDEGRHQATRWQLARGCDGFGEPLLDLWRQRDNWYGGVDLQADDDLTDEVLRDLAGDQDYCWRVRYRDDGLAWSDWSEPTTFRTRTLEVTGELLTNPGAEEGLAGWTAITGNLEPLAEGECGGVSPHGGLRYFAVGGLCESAAEGLSVQHVDVAPWAARIDAGEARAELVAWLCNQRGLDQPGAQLLFLDGTGAELGTGPVLATSAEQWTELRDHELLPPGTRTVDVALLGHRMAGAGNHSFADDLSLRLSFSADAGCQEAGPVVEGGDADLDAEGDRDGEGDRDAAHDDARSSAGGGGCLGCSACAAGGRGRGLRGLLSL